LMEMANRMNIAKMQEGGALQRAQIASGDKDMALYLRMLLGLGGQTQKSGKGTANSTVVDAQ